MPLIKEWQNRPLQSVYAVVFLDAIHFKVKQEGATVNKAAYMVIGIDLDGNKDVLGMWMGENESSKFDPYPPPRSRFSQLYLYIWGTTTILTEGEGLLDYLVTIF
ncbi:hypothetical protein PCURB6_44170 [Paenibacillus curdlanolyticus]|nr:hypothetical protein PCURB6_44170 [Paenibacillus curdlanolyticus]